VPNQNIEDDFEKLERAFTGYAIFFKHQARKVKGRATRKDFQQKALISSMLAMICNNLRTII
jgi:hypothetical protein